jgi:hypothetical protein
MVEMAIPIIHNITLTYDKSGSSSFEKLFIQDPEDNVDNWSCGGEDTTLQSNPLSSKLVYGKIKSTSRHNGLHEEHNHRGNGYISISTTREREREHECQRECELQRWDCNPIRPPPRVRKEISFSRRDKSSYD